MDESRKKRRWPKRVAIGASIVVLAAGVAFGLLQTSWAKRKVAGVVAKTLGKQLKSEVTIEGLKGIVPFRLHVDEVVFEANGKPWLAIKGVQVKPAMYAILRGKTHIYHLSAESVLLEGTPPKTEKKPKPWRESIPKLTIEKLSAGEFTIGEALAGERLVFRVDGGMVAANRDEHVYVELNAERTDGKKGSVSLTMDLSDTLDLKASVDEGENGIIARLLGIEKPGDLEASVDGRGPLDKWKGHLHAKVAGSGEVTADVAANIKNEPFDLLKPNPRLSGDIGIVLERESGDLDASGAFQLFPGAFRAENVKGNGLGSSFSGSIEYDISSKLMNGKVEGTFEDLSVLGGILGKDLRGSATISAEMDSRDGRQNADIELSGTGIESEFGNVGTVDLSGRVRDAFGRFTATGKINVRSYSNDGLLVDELGAEIDGNADEMTFMGEISGTYREPFKLNTSGTLRDKQVVHLDLLSAKYGEIPVDLLSPTTLEAESGRYSLGETALRIGEGKFTAKADYGEEGVDGEIEFAEVPAMMLHRAGAPELSGTGSGSVRLSGSLQSPVVDVAVDLADMKPTDPSCGDIPPMMVHVEGRLDAGRLTAKLTAKGEEGVLVDGNCQLPVELSLDPVGIKLDGGGKLTGNLAVKSKIDEIVSLFLPEGCCVSGMLDLEVSASGTVDGPVMTGKVKVDEGGCSIREGEKAVSGVSLATAFSLKDGMFELPELSLTSDQGSVTGKATMKTGGWPWEAGMESAITGEVNAKGEIGQYIQLVLPQDEKLAGVVDADVRFGGTLGNPILDGHIGVADGKYTSAKTGEVDVAVNADVKIGDGTMSISNARISVMDLEIEGNMDLRTAEGFAAFSDQTEMRGEWTVRGEVFRAAEIILGEDRDLHAQVDGRVELSGRLGEPVTVGSISITDGEYVEMEQGTVLKNIKAEILPQGRRLVLKSLDATDGETGKVTATGWLDLDPGRSFPFEIKAKADKATLVRTDEVRGSANADVLVAGNVEDLRVSGKVETVNVQVRLPESSVPEIKSLNIVEINKDGEAIKPPKEKKQKDLAIRLDLHISIPARAFVKGYGLDSEWEGKLDVGGSVDKPEIAGELGVTRGNFKFVSKRLDLTRGKIYFSGGKDPKPMLDVTAETTADDITAYIRLSGFLNAPEITFSSSPTLPQDEILARILFGKDVAKLSPLQALRIAQMVNKLAGGGGNAFSFFDNVQQTMGVDWLDISSNGDDKGTSVTAGKYLGDGIYVEVKKDIEDDGAGVSVEKEVTKNISVESEVGTTGGTGFGVKWKWDY